MLAQGLALLLFSLAAAHNTTFTNPILPGFYPDPSCVYVAEWNQTIFCASSSFNVFPGIPVHASNNLVDWNLISA
jgi:beta-xylosidase